MPHPLEIHAIKTQAEDQVSRYPQYRGHFDDYILVAIRRDVNTKMGMAFERGELAIAKPQPRESTDVHGRTNVFRTVWSLANGCDTSIRERDLVVCA